MLKQINIIDIMLLFARYTSTSARDELSKQPTNSQKDGYTELMEQILSIKQVPNIDIDNYIFSVNEKTLSDRIKGLKGTVLFVECGSINLTSPHETLLNLAITVSSELTSANNDLINETLAMQSNLATLTDILQHLEQEQSTNLDFCPALSNINFPASIHPVQAKNYFDHCGWVAMFQCRIPTL